MALAIFLTLTVALGVLTLLPLWRHEAWWVRAMDFPRLQLAATAAVVIAIEWALLDFSKPGPWMLVVGGWAILACQLWWITPYTTLFPFEVDPATDMDRRRVWPRFTRSTIRFCASRMLTAPSKTSTLHTPVTGLKMKETSLKSSPLQGNAKQRLIRRR
jgi:hypothetical protein